MKRKLVVLCLTILLGACSSTPMKPAEVAQPPAAQPSVKPAAAPEMKPVMETEAQRIDRIIKVLASKSIYFDYDKYTIKPEYESLLKQNFEMIKSAPKVAFRLEGNADERGSTEYNIALGQKRAEAVKRALLIMGIPDSQLEAISYGEEKPRATCHEEKCWAENRRVDFTKKSP
ncbi:Peptidoglycan-associated protein [Georgfuchsia toluolica]|uniref:Peptidoglycan-associated lipoprotein n=1 Tax=Georgfuchsia toluolica TaxID=424218 RepID=A0A916J6W3_9PROT|nr:peptidoglycan-associated lipoprotein Pal [Georgfuchsia toluolica]CAG4885037.1 Peptidoglycan-associated protein [Georgfuchsia toluolica]